MEEPIFSFSMRFGSVLFGSVQLEYRSFGIRYIRYLPASVIHVHWFYCQYEELRQTGKIRKRENKIKEQEAADLQATVA